MSMIHNIRKGVLSLVTPLKAEKEQEGKFRMPYFRREEYFTEIFLPGLPDTSNPLKFMASKFFSDNHIIILDLLDIMCNTIFREVSEVFVVSSSKDSGLCSFPIT